MLRPIYIRLWVLSGWLNHGFLVFHLSFRRKYSHCLNKTEHDHLSNRNTSLNKIVTWSSWWFNRDIYPTWLQYHPQTHISRDYMNWCCPLLFLPGWRDSSLHSSDCLFYPHFQFDLARHRQHLFQDKFVSLACSTYAYCFEHYPLKINQKNEPNKPGLFWPSQTASLDWTWL